ncbi:MAG: GIY-YIG nuclease family protein [Neisseria sp.]|nr:GIY-YIG nuclease family protein [Neisseria sp.]
MNDFWQVYLIECANGAFYCGIAKDVAKRYAAHVAGKGAKFTRMHKPLSVRLVACHLDRKTAMQYEILVKKLTRLAKEQLWQNASIVACETSCERLHEQSANQCEN